MNEDIRDRFLATGDAVLNGKKIPVNGGGSSDIIKSIKASKEYTSPALSERQVAVGVGASKKISKRIFWFLVVLSLGGVGYYMHEPKKVPATSGPKSLVKDGGSIPLIVSNENKEKSISEDETSIVEKIASIETKNETYSAAAKEESTPEGEANVVEKIAPVRTKTEPYSDVISEKKAAPIFVDLSSDAEIQKILYEGVPLDGLKSLSPNYIDRFDLSKDGLDLLVASSTSPEKMGERAVGLVFYTRDKNNGDSWKIIGKNSNAFKVSTFSHVIPTNGVYIIGKTAEEITFVVVSGDFTLDANGYHKKARGSDFQSRRQFSVVTLRLLDGRVFGRRTGIYIDTKYPHRISEYSLEKEKRLLVESEDASMSSMRLYSLSNLDRAVCSLNYNKISNQLQNDTCKIVGLNFK